MAKFKTVAEVFKDPERWTRGAGARDRHGIYVRPDSPNAVSWCLVGATSLIYGDDDRAYLTAINKLKDGLIKRGIEPAVSVWNDRTANYTQLVELVKEAGV